MCDLAQHPADFIGHEITLRDTIIVDGHGDPLLIPDASCPAFLSVQVAFHELQPEAKRQFVELIRSLGTTASINGHAAGVTGTYKLRVLSRSQPSTLAVSLVKASNIRIGDAEAKMQSLMKQTPSEPTRS
jgi:hypothetical protein